MLKFIYSISRGNREQAAKLYDAGKLLFEQEKLAQAKESFIKVLNIDPY